MLASPEIELHVIKKEDNFDLFAIEPRLEPDKCVLVYPSSQSIGIREYVEQQKGIELDLPNTLIFIDASWKQALGMYERHKFLKKCVMVNLNEVDNSRYRIRKAKHDHYLSTLEAVAITLNSIYSTSIQPYLNILENMQQHWYKHIQ